VDDDNTRAGKIEVPGGEIPDTLSDETVKNGLAKVGDEIEVRAADEAEGLEEADEEVDKVD
jgi:hypothetical protein